MSRVAAHLSAYVVFWLRMARCVLTGSRLYYSWMAYLLFVIGLGVASYIHHLTEGLAVTNMTDQVPWGIGIANFVYFVGVADAAVLLIVPAFAFGDRDAKKVVIVGQIMAICTIIMCLLFIFSDIGRPDRFWHMIPGAGGILNLPYSMLAWDVLAFSGYLVLNLHIPGYLLYKIYRGERPDPRYYVPVIFISIVWAVAMHTVTAFLLSGLGSRPFWNTALLAPRFLISAFASGPAVLILIFAVMTRYTPMLVASKVTDYLVKVMQITMPVNLFLLACEVFKEFYTNTLHTAAAKYLYFGLPGHMMLSKFIWTSIVFNVVATAIFLSSKLRSRPVVLYIGCGMAMVGIWIEKGMGLVFPGFIPTPLGEFVDYWPNLEETFVSFGVIAIGTLLFTVGAKVAIHIESGRLRMNEEATRRSWPE